MVPLPETGDHTIWPTLEGRGFGDLRALAEAKAGA
jgi:hypothetical protein